MVIDVMKDQMDSIEYHVLSVSALKGMATITSVNAVSSLLQIDNSWHAPVKSLTS